MKMFLTAMTAACAIGAAAPAAAQFVNLNAGGIAGIDNRIAQLDARLQAGIRAGLVDRTEAMNLRAQLRDLRRTEGIYARNGISQRERMDLQARIRDLRANIRLADNGRFDRDTRYGAWDNGAGYDQYGNRIDTSVRYDQYGNRIDTGVRYDQYGNRIDTGGVRYDQYGNRVADNGYYGQGGPYEEADDYTCVDRGGLAGVIDSVTGRTCAGLRVGARVSSSLGAVPYEYRSQYRDGNGYYYRSDGRNIYQVDARTNTVVRIYDVNR
jgi:hypothetical protein